MTHVAILKKLTVDASPDDVREVSYFLGECCSGRDLRPLEEAYERLRQVRRSLPDETWLRGCVDALIVHLEGYFARHEPTLRFEALVRELDQHPLWRQLLGYLATSAANQETMRIALDDKISKGTVSVALEELRLRELVEYVPSPDRRQRIHDLTARGREVVAAAKIPHRAVSPPPQARPDRPQAVVGAAVETGPPSGTPRRGRVPSGEQTKVVRPATTVE